MFTQDFEDGGAPAAEFEGFGRRAGSEEVAPSAAEGRAFQRAWSHAVALAWSDAAMLDALKRAPARFLEAHCGYTLPDSIALQVGDLPVDGAPVGWDPEREAWCLPKAEITLYVPPAPALEERDVALAELADPCEDIPVCC